MREGREVLVRLAGAGDSVGHRSLFVHSAYRGSAVALTPVVACRLSAGACLSLLGRQPAFAEALIRRIARDLDLAHGRNWSFHERSVRERLAWVLLELGRSFGQELEGGEVELSLPLRRDELASLVGAAEENVIRLLSELKAQGHVAEEGRRLRLCDRGALLRLSGAAPESADKD
jgi:CRP-like cAMP-binding protein